MVFPLFLASVTAEIDLMRIKSDVLVNGHNYRTTEKVLHLANIAVC